MIGGSDAVAVGVTVMVWFHQAAMTRQTDVMIGVVVWILGPLVGVFLIALTIKALL